MITIDTNSVAQGKRAAFWQESFRGLRSSAVVVERGDAARFRARLRARALGSLRLVEVSASPHRAVFLPVEDRVSVHVHLEGRAAVDQGRQHKPVDRGSVHLEDDRRPHRITLGSDCRVFCISMPMRALAEQVPQWERYTRDTVRLGQQAGRIFLDHVGSLRRLLAFPGEAASAQTEALTYDFLAFLLDSSNGSLPPAPSRLDAYHAMRIKAFIREHLDDPALDTGSIAAGVGLSARHVQRLFSARSQHVMEWVWQERLDGCYRSLIRPGPGPRISDVAYAWGFSSPAHFSRVFRDRYGASPREIKAMAGQAAPAHAE